MNVQLIFSEADVRSLLAGQLSENLYAEFIGSAMYEAQEVYLVEFLGRPLLTSLKKLAQRGTTADSFDDGYDASFGGGAAGGVYAELLDEVVKPFLIYKTMTRIVPKVALKVANVGAYQSSDEKVTPVQREVWNDIIDDYNAQAAHFLDEMLRWLRANENKFTKKERRGLRLGSSTITGVWLGGAVGR